MRSRIQEWFGVCVLFCVSASSIYMWIKGTLPLYIHPRYIVFTGVMSTVALMVCIVVFLRKVSHTHTNSSSLGKVSTSLVLFMLAALILLPPASLSYKLAQNRGAGYDVPITGTKKVKLNSSTEKFNLEEWASLISQTADIQKITAKKAHFSGFIIPIESKPDEFLVAKFVITCCAVDARPVTVPIKFTNWNQKFKADEWVSVRGITEVEDGMIVVRAENVESIGKPKNPYAN